jgi:hypothetical protein
MIHTRILDPYLLKGEAIDEERHGICWRQRLIVEVNDVRR